MLVNTSISCSTNLNFAYTVFPLITPTTPTVPLPHLVSYLILKLQDVTFTSKKEDSSCKISKLCHGNFQMTINSDCSDMYFNSVQLQFDYYQISNMYLLSMGRRLLKGGAYFDQCVKRYSAYFRAALLWGSVLTIEYTVNSILYELQIPHLYCIPTPLLVPSPTCLKFVHKIKAIQKKSLRFMLSDYGSSYEDF